ncbi:hypothetical protein IFM89_036266 [Coptis chinensis]|uniref:Uncharacterized protein n=1 Tax=Coptis chinensis TaxID=261450 RepID=A0A835HUG6_9MAGN|nr:hypothetical protein IFM89_036266 [Coptis chinensis]
MRKNKDTIITNVGESTTKEQGQTSDGELLKEKDMVNEVDLNEGIVEVHTSTPIQNQEEAPSVLNEEHVETQRVSASVEAQWSGLSSGVNFAILVIPNMTRLYKNFFEALKVSSPAWFARNQAYYTEQAYYTRNRQLGLSGWKLEECTAIENELLVWKQKCLTEREGIFPALTKLDDYSLSFSMLKKALGVPENNVRTYIEAENQARYCLSVILNMSKSTIFGVESSEVDSLTSCIEY